MRGRRIAPTLAVLFGAFLGFMAQPMAGKAVLPSAGGSPAVWNACLVFFQLTFLFGYGYAFYISRISSIRRQALIHGSLVLASLVVSSWGIPPLRSWPIDATGIVPIQILVRLSVSVGPLAVMLAATAPLIHAWASRSGAFSDPYVLYAASNIGSLIGLVAYPALIERILSLSQQFTAWTVMAGVALACMLATAIQTTGAREVAPAVVRTKAVIAGRWQWFARAAVPSALLVALTTHFTTDLASVPLLWIPPLALYLLSFIIAFGAYSGPMRLAFGGAAPLALLCTLYMVIEGDKWPVVTSVIVYLVCFAVVCVACNGELAWHRPKGEEAAPHFYLAIAAGGAFGGLVCALIFPIIGNPLFYSSSHWFGGALRLAASTFLANVPVPELVVAVTLTAFLVPGAREKGLRDWAFVIASIALAIVLAKTSNVTAMSLHAKLGMSGDHAQAIAKVGLPLAVSYLAAALASSRAFGFATSGTVVVLLVSATPLEGTLHHERTFFGVLRVSQHEDGTRRLLHGTTVHGAQAFGDRDKEKEARTYYAEAGPLGDIIRAYISASATPKSIAAVGLGVGTIAAYARPLDRLLFFELDPSVERLATLGGMFTYVPGAIERGATVGVEIGDGRLLLEKSAASFDLIILDAFSSDSIPVHLLTIEAVQTYLKRLRLGGAIAFHVSNRYFDLEPVVAAAADRLGLVSFARYDAEPSTPGAYVSRWVLVSRPVAGLFPDPVPSVDANASFLGPAWGIARTSAKVDYWTDDRADILSALLLR